MSALFTQCPGDTVQIRTGKVDPARKFKCTTAARDTISEIFNVIKRLFSTVVLFKCDLLMYAAIDNTGNFANL